MLKLAIVFIVVFLIGCRAATQPAAMPKVRGVIKLPASWNGVELVVVRSSVDSVCLEVDNALAEYSITCPADESPVVDGYKWAVPTGGPVGAEVVNMCLYPVEKAIVIIRKSEAPE